MYNKETIIRILREQSRYITESSKPIKSNQRFAEFILKQRHKFITKYNQKRREENPNFIGYSDDYDEFILSLKNRFPLYSGFGHLLQTTINPSIPNPSLMGVDVSYLAKIITEYILNYGNDTNVIIDVVSRFDIDEYVENEFFRCDVDFFNSVWNNILPFMVYSLWGGDIKEKMWDKIHYMLVKKMENEGIDVEDTEFVNIIQKEKEQFIEHWYYPLQSLGWDESRLCDFYREYFNSSDLTDYLFSEEKNDVEDNKMWTKLYLGDVGSYYIIDRNRLFKQ